MKQKIKILMILILLFVLCNPIISFAKDKYVVAVLPFTSHSAQNIDYLRYGIWDMLSSRISYQEKIQVIEKDVISGLLKENKDLSSSEIMEIGNKLKADYVVWGSLTKIGSALSVDGKLYDVTSVSKPALSIFYQCQNDDEVIPKINEFAQKIDYHILGAVPESLNQSAPSTASTSAGNTGSPRDSQIIRTLRSSPQGTLTAAINAEFINSPEPIDRQGFWMSQKFPTKFKGMDIGDVNNDGKNEVVMIDDYNIYIYQKKNKDFNVIKKIAGKPHEKYLSVDVADINENGIPEIIVTRLINNYLRSFVYEFKNEQFVLIADKISYFLRVIEMPDGTPTLIGQSLGLGNSDPFMTPIYEMIWKDGTYKSGKKLMIPEGLSVYSVSFVNFRDSGADKILVIDDLDRISIYEKTYNPLSKVNAVGGSPEYVYRSDEVFGGTNNLLDLTDRQTSDETVKKNYYVNLRTFSFDTNKDGKKELIIVKNLSGSGRYFSNVRDFTSAEIYDLEWDGLGFIENWRTKKINGYVCDYQFKDIDNDGQKEIVLALVLSVSGSLQNTSVIAAYDLLAQ